MPAKRLPHSPAGTTGACGGGTGGMGGGEGGVGGEGGGMVRRMVWPCAAPAARARACYAGANPPPLETRGTAESSPAPPPLRCRCARGPAAALTSSTVELATTGKPLALRADVSADWPAAAPKMVTAASACSALLAAQRTTTCVGRRGRVTHLKCPRHAINCVGRRGQCALRPGLAARYRPGSPSPHGPAPSTQALSGGRTCRSLGLAPASSSGGSCEARLVRAMDSCEAGEEVSPCGEGRGRRAGERSAAAGAEPQPGPGAYGPQSPGPPRSPPT
jgi:hypothetical protein